MLFLSPIFHHIHYGWESQQLNVTSCWVLSLSCSHQWLYYWYHLSGDGLAIESHVENLLSRTILGTKYLWVSLKAMPDIRTWVWVVYLGSDPTKHEHPGKKNGMVKEEETMNVRVLYSDQYSGQQGIFENKECFQELVIWRMEVWSFYLLTLPLWTAQLLWYQRRSWGQNAERRAASRHLWWESGCRSWVRTVHNNHGYSQDGEVKM